MSNPDRARRFWNEQEKYHDLAKKYEENIVMEHPKHLSGRSKNGASWCNCAFCATRVEYPKYEGPRVASL
jgi:hypothetical protein